MLPSIPPGTLLRIECGNDAHGGDIIFFLHRGQPVVHRLLSFSRNGRWILTRGDANPIPDLPVERETLIGRITSVAGNAVPQPAETRSQSLARHLASAALALGAAPARLMLRFMWRLWGTNLKAATAWRLYGAPGFLARVWSHTVGAIIDIDVIYTGRFTPTETFTPVKGYRYERAQAGSPRFTEAVRMLRSDEVKRAQYDAFLAIDQRDDSLAACTFSEGADGPVAFNRGVAADPRHRGKSLAGSLLLYQAWSIQRQGAREVEYHVSVTNRGARRMFRKIGAQEIDCWVIIVLLRRFRFSRRFAFDRARQPNPS